MCVGVSTGVSTGGAPDQLLGPGLPVGVVGQPSLHLVQRVHGGRGRPAAVQSGELLDRISSKILPTMPHSRLTNQDQ